MITSRQYEDAGDLRLMQALVRESWRREKPYVTQHAGDLDWWMYQHEHTRSEAHERIRLWFEGDELVGWAWLELPAALDFHLHPDHRSGVLLAGMLDWLKERAHAAVETGTAVSELCVYALEHDTATVTLLEQRGFRATEQCDVHTLRGLGGELPDPALPEGFSVRPVRGEEDLANRVAVHRAAFAPSKVTEESYRNVMRSATYRPDLDMVVVAPDGTFASYCLCWFDAENGVGEFEPVGTHPDFQRRGLARAVCAAALHRLRELGADTAIVYYSWDGAGLLYQSLGFREITRLRRFSMPPRPGS
jgi:ribosomal protein S18 acetylase RimI-like enzyme